MKKFTAALFFLSCFLCVCCHAQVMFQKTYGGDSTETLSKCIATTDGGYLLAGSTKSFGNGDYDMLLVKTNSDGDMVWSKTYGDSLHDEYIYSVQQTTDGGFIITGKFKNISTGFSDIPLIKTDGSGNILWSKMFNGVYSNNGNSVHQTFDGGYLLSGDGYLGAYLIRTNNSGDTLWTRSYSGGLNDGYRTFILENTDGSIIFTFRTMYQGFGGDHAMIKTDASGNVLWSKAIFDFTIIKAIHTNDGGYIFGGVCCGGLESFPLSVALIKTNGSGDTLWTKRYTYSYVSFQDIQQVNDGGYVITGGGVGGNDALLLKTDNNGNLFWARNFGGSNYDKGVSSLQAADGGYVVTGVSTSFGAGAEDFYFVKTDSLGVSGCYESPHVLPPPNPLQIDTITIITGHPQITISTIAPPVSIPPIQTTTLCIVGIDEINKVENSVTVFPNPAATEIRIRSQESGIKSIEIYDVLGEEIFSRNVTGTNTIEININAAAFASGMYFISVKTADGVVGKKVIVER